MPSQRDLFGRVVATQARDAAIQQVEEHADPDWKAEAGGVVFELACEREEFTTDDVWAAMSNSKVTHERRALGSIMLTAARRNLIEATDRYIQSERVACHARPVRVWRSLVFEK